jgi:hypothetical protein
MINTTQIDYILISERFRSAIQSCKVRWGPAIRRFGFRFDHGMVSAVLRFKIKRRQPQPNKAVKKDWGKLGTDKELQTEFEKAYQRAKVKMLARREKAAEAEAATSELLYTELCDSVKEAETVLPNLKRDQRKARVSSAASIEKAAQAGNAKAVWAGSE